VPQTYIKIGAVLLRANVKPPDVELTGMAVDPSVMVGTPAPDLVINL
jgi:hypothetical protein